jgi:DMSO reductase iron-sulfur subunit
MISVRPEEPAYAFVPPSNGQERNQWDKPIQLVDDNDPLAGKSLRINGDAGISDNPDRYKQHGFFFTADNCIGCHACEAACSEKNALPAHISFRSVGYVEGGSYPDYRRINISMACNHCDDPVCLKGCPTRAYTKFAEYGAVLQDPDICFGCGYCTWVCPYNAPQLDPIQGQVSKCNMCVDRLEVGLKPACASACLGGALDFGVVETKPENREQAKLSIPGFPTPEITHPNIRFQQTKALPKEMTRPDTATIKYRQTDKPGEFKSTVDPKLGDKRQWNLKALLTSHENAHIAFTLSAQAVMGAFFLLTLMAWLGEAPLREFKSTSAFLPLLGALVVLNTFGLVKLNLHLGKPLRFYRGFNNLALSPVSREIAGVSLFFASLVAYSFFALFDNGFAKVLCGLFGLAGLAGLVVGGYYMYKLYRIPARPYWNHWHTGAAFAGSGLSLGALLIALVAVAYGVLTPRLAALLGAWTVSGLALEAAGLIFHARDLQAQGSEGAASLYEQSTRYGKPYWLRNGLLALSLALALGIGLGGAAAPAWLMLLAATALASAILGRALFYVLVIPTTMPGAFFWRNKGFEAHARETGLADLPQTGVLSHRH